MKRSTRKRGLKVETLENRSMLAGNVTVAVTAGKLVITGDTVDNTIAIAAGAQSGAFLVTGTGTTVNGSSAALPAFTGVTAGFEIKMNEGADSVTMGSLTVPLDLKVDMGAGADTLTFNSGVNVAREANIDTSTGNDTVTATSLTVGARLELKTGGNNDTVTLTTVIVNQSATANGSTRKSGEADIDSGDLNDNVTINGLTAKRLNLRTGRGLDTASVKATVDRLTVKMGHNSDTLTLDAASAIASRLSLRGGTQTDTLNNDFTGTAKRTIRGFENIS